MQPRRPSYFATTARRWLVALSLVSTASLAVVAAEIPKEEAFSKTILPILKDTCFKCHSHSADKVKGGLMLDSREGLLAGGDSGAAMVPGKPEESLLIKAVSYEDADLQMPPPRKGDRLSAEQIEVLRQWIRDGAHWPGSDLPKTAKSKPFTDEDRAWWAIQPMRRVEPPKVAGDTWSRDSIDRFVLQKMSAAGLKPAPEADRRTLIRRLSFDLTGLPASPEDIDRFVADPSPDAYEQLVARLLQSPRYGERWARHWLDLVRYAESDGYRVDDYRPNAWRYRDYVIKAFNDDKPYDRFIAEQLAGDEIAPNSPDAITATSFLRLWIYEYNNRDAITQWQTILNDVTDTTSDVFLGLGIQCAKCHDHKFDPILQKDYFRLQAYFAALLPRDDVPAATAEEFLNYQSKLRAWEAKTAELRAEIDAIRRPYLDQADQDALSKLGQDLQGLIAKPRGERTPYEHQVAELAHQQVIYEEKYRTEGKIKGADRERLDALRKELAKFDELKPASLPDVMTATDVGPFAPATYVPKKKELGAIDPGILTLLDPAPAKIQPLPSAPNSTGRRAELARWLTQPDNPLTSRVMVNRVWQYHFGRGLSVNASDFGRLGETPTHPELLDWLATEFVRNGWSLKKLHEVIVTSATYRQAADHPDLAAGMTKDPDNKLLWHATIRRLEAEQIRDAMLAVSGELDLAPGGASVPPGKPRRTVYTKVMRNTRDPFLEVFDLPEGFTSTSKRNITTTPVQSLTMINGKFTLERARALAQRLLTSGRVEHADQIEEAFRQVLGRQPAPDERRMAASFLKSAEDRVRRQEMKPVPLAFVSEKMPFREGRAAVMKPGSHQDRFEAPAAENVALTEFTIEAFVVLKSVYEDGAVRTIVSQWNGDKSAPGWALGVTGKKSAFKPQTLVLQLTTGPGEGEGGYEAIFSDLNLELNKPYYVAASVQMNETNETGVVFYRKDLSNDDEPLRSEGVGHRRTGAMPCVEPVTIGGRAAGEGHLFDGLIDDVRYSSRALAKEQLLLTSEGAGAETLGFWQFETETQYHRDVSGKGRDLKLKFEELKPLVPEEAALADFCHVLLNANEFLYVD